MMFAFLKKSKSTFIINTVFVLLFVFALLVTGHFLFFDEVSVEAEIIGCQESDIVGWGWSSNTGWISLSCNNLNTEHDYGINIDEGTGELFGYAWSENTGWIRFSKDDFEGECPSNGECVAEIVSGNSVSGWAQVANNDEWISLSGDIYEEEVKVGEYGIEIQENEFSGWAWGDTTLGWIRFTPYGRQSGTIEIIYGDNVEVINVGEGGTIERAR